MKKLWKAFDISLLSFFAAVTFFAVITFSSRNIGILGLFISCVFFGVKVYYYSTRKTRLLNQISTVSDELDFEQGKAFETLTVPCVVIEKDGTIIWLNDSSSECFRIDETSSERNLKQLIKKENIEKLIAGRGYSLNVDNNYFSVYSNEIPLDNEETIYLLYFFNQTELRLIEKEYYATRPSVMLTVLDNAGEIYQSFKESECAAIFSRIEQMMVDWASSYGALCRKYSSARMLIFVEERGLQKMIEDKFSILSDIRNFIYDGRETDITLSVGVGKSDDINKANTFARQAIDMAQSRGGDQVAIKKDSEYVFYGGLSAGFEKKNKVRTRLIAKSIAEIIADSNSVLIMGHRFSDFDSFGAAVGMHSIAEHLAVKSQIVINDKATLAYPLIEKFISEKSSDKLISPENALRNITDNTLLIIVDTHRQNFTECPELVDKVKKVMVIDHHRKSVGYIEDTVMFYHMPNSSSASEMVVEIAQYIEIEPFITRFEATALMAGIMLDTRNFILRAGVRTFEAAAFLRSRGANTVECKKLFSNDMDLFRYRNSIIDLADEYKDCAISVVNEEFPDIRLVTSQAADEMLNIEGIKATFVIFRSGSTTNISARSYGEINVQLIMESLGGGGHQTMSACQLKDKSVTEAESILKNAIDEFFNNKHGG